MVAGGLAVALLAPGPSAGEQRRRRAAAQRTTHAPDCTGAGCAKPRLAMARSSCGCRPASANDGMAAAACGGAMGTLVAAGIARCATN